MKYLLNKYQVVIKITTAEKTMWQTESAYYIITNVKAGNKIVHTVQF